MSGKSPRSRDTLFARADMATAKAIAIRERVKVDRTAAGQKQVHRPPSSDIRPLGELTLGPMVPLSFLEPWWSIGHALTVAGEIIREADRELESGWHRILPTIEIPLSVFRG